jgi:WD40 repeat protein
VGLQVYSVPQYELVAQDADYGHACVGMDFSISGWLVTACLDGYLRLYDPMFRLRGKVRAPSGNIPIKVAFSPDGSRIAVGFGAPRRVDVLSARDLSLQYTPDTSGSRAEDLAIVAFSNDGNTLFAGGADIKDGVGYIRVWQQAGHGAWRDNAVCRSEPVRILSLRNREIVYGAEDPAWGLFGSDGKRRIWRRAEIANLFGQTREFLVSSDGSHIQFGYGQQGKSPAVFSIAARQLVFGAAQSVEMAAPIVFADGLEIAKWEHNSLVPTLNGQRLKLNELECSTSLAIAPDGRSFLLGTQTHLRLFDRNGRQYWKTLAPNQAWVVNIAGNGRVALAGFSDGTIRWHRMTDGKELLAFFPHGDRKRWVLWTPAGYYDCSPGAEELIGWHVNNGSYKAADFFPASRFRSTFYRPDVISKILDTLDEAEAVRLANAEAGRRAQTANVVQVLPPVVTVLSPHDGDTVSSEEVEVKYTTRAAEDAPVTAVRALVDGRPLEGARGVAVVAAATGSSLKVRLPGRDCEVALVAENRHGASVPSRVRLKWSGQTTEEFVAKPKLYALLIGVSEYADEKIRLKYAAKDARDFAAALEKQKGGLYQEVTVKLLTDQQAAKDEVLDALDWIRKQATSKDIAVVFLSGHGVNDSDGSYYYLPANVNVEKLMRTGVRFSDIRETVASIAGKALFFVDTCHAGNVMGGRRGLDDITRLVNELSSAENGAVVFAASTGRQYSLENDDWQNGAFTKALIEGIGGKADYNNKGRITINMLDLYLSERVKELTGGKQTPTTTKPQTIPDFPVAMPVR